MYRPYNKGSKKTADEIPSHQNGGDADYSSSRNILSISGFIKAYIGKGTLSGGWDEYLYNSLSVYETLSHMCQVTRP